MTWADTINLTAAIGIASLALSLLGAVLLTPEIVDYIHRRFGPPEMPSWAWRKAARLPVVRSARR